MRLWTRFYGTLHIEYCFNFILHVFLTQFYEFVSENVEIKSINQNDIKLTCHQTQAVQQSPLLWPNPGHRGERTGPGTDREGWTVVDIGHHSASRPIR